MLCLHIFYLHYFRCLFKAHSHCYVGTQPIASHITALFSIICTSSLTLFTPSVQDTQTALSSPTQWFHRRLCLLSADLCKDFYRLYSLLARPTRLPPARRQPSTSPPATKARNTVWLCGPHNKKKRQERWVKS